jgi:hypothetical protein
MTIEDIKEELSLRWRALCGKVKKEEKKCLTTLKFIL